MILKALYDYYNRCGNEIAPIGMAYVNFYYSIVINQKGDFIRLEALGDDDGLPLLVFRPEERTQAPVPHCMGDNGSYLLGLKDINPKKNFDYSKELKSNLGKFESFKEDVEAIYKSLPHNGYAIAVHNFYSKLNTKVIDSIRREGNWENFCKFLSKNITFSIDGKAGFAATDSEIIKVKLKNKINDNKEEICLITGNKQRPVSTTYSTFIIGGKSNAKLVSFQTSSGYDSYGKRMGLNAPISEEAEFKYTTALLKLLAKGSRNKFKVGNRTFVFWASAKNDIAEQSENAVFELLGYSEKEEDDPNAKIEQVRKVFTSIYSGNLNTKLEDRFYILGLAPNSARIAVVYCSETSLRDFAAMILRHFNDMDIIDTRPKKLPYKGVKGMLRETLRLTPGAKINDADVTPNLPEAVVKSVFQGTPYPYPLFTACINRIRAEKGNEVRTGRIAILKAFLNRINDDNKKISTMLDKENINQAYLCGRLFAVLEKAQEDALKVNTIRERYMNAASSTPAAVFATILNLSSHHMEKFESSGLKVHYEKLKQEIISKISADGFPTHLDLQDQGRFFVGYYHQRQDFFTKKGENIEQE